MAAALTESPSIIMIGTAARGSAGLGQIQVEFQKQSSGPEVKDQASRPPQAPGRPLPVSRPPGPGAARVAAGVLGHLQANST